MQDNHLFRYICILFVVSFLFSSCTDGKGFGGGRVGNFKGGGFRGGSRGGGIFGSSKGRGIFGGPSSYNRINSYRGYNNMKKQRMGSNFRSNAMSFGAGALGGLTAYSLMRSISSSYHERPGYYAPGYGTGETCYNSEDLNGTVFGQFRCPLNEFPYAAKYCCGEHGKQYCCIREQHRRIGRSTSQFGWIFLIILILFIVGFLYAKHRRQRQKVVMIPVEPTANEQQAPFYYQPPPPPMGYPTVPSNGNPYVNSSQNFNGNFPSDPRQYQMPNSTRQQFYNVKSVKEGNPPSYDEVVSANQDVPTSKPVQNQ